jgi:gamma-glutamylaminecyclotransferase
MFVFVYGTLKKNFNNHYLLERSKFEGKATISGFKMVDLGAFPGAVRTEDQSVIHGEVYSISLDTLKRLDQLEGHPDFYKRERVSTKYGQAWVYALPELYLENVVIYTGEWKYG